MWCDLTRNGRSRARISLLDLSHLCQIRLNFTWQGSPMELPCNQASLASESALGFRPRIALSSARLIAILYKEFNACKPEL